MVHRQAKKIIRIEVKYPKTSFFTVQFHEVIKKISKKMSTEHGSNIAIHNKPQWVKHDETVEIKFTVAGHITDAYEQELLSSVFELIKQEIDSYVQTQLPICPNFKAEYITVTMVSVDDTLTAEQKLQQQQQAELEAALKQLALKQTQEFQALHEKHEDEKKKLVKELQAKHATEFASEN